MAVTDFLAVLRKKNIKIKCIPTFISIYCAGGIKILHMPKNKACMYKHIINGFRNSSWL